MRDMRGAKARLLWKLFLPAVIISWIGLTLYSQSWSPIVTVGPGYVDCYTRQVIRTSADVVYVVTNASGFSGGTAPASIRVYRGSPAGNPVSFAEMDAGHRPANSVRMGGVEAKIAGAENSIQVVYEDIGAGQTRYVKFDTLTNTWGAPEVIGPLNGLNTANRYMGKTGLALDASGAPHVVSGGVSERMYYTNRIGGSWTAPVLVGGDSADMHPSLAFDRAGVLHLAYYDGNVNLVYRPRDPITAAPPGADTAPAH